MGDKFLHNYFISQVKLYNYYGYASLIQYKQVKKQDCKHNLSPMILKGDHANGIIVKLGNNFTNINEITNFDYP